MLFATVTASDPHSASARAPSLAATTTIHVQDDRKTREGRPTVFFQSLLLTVTATLITVLYTAATFAVHCPSCAAAVRGTSRPNKTSCETTSTGAKLCGGRMNATNAVAPAKSNLTSGKRTLPLFKLPLTKLRLRGVGCGTFLRGDRLPSAVALQHVLAGAPLSTEIATIDYLVTYVNPLKSAPGSQKLHPQRIRDWNELYWNLRSLFYHGRLCVFENSSKRCLLGKIHLVVASKDEVPEWLARRLQPATTSEAGTQVELNFRRFLRDRLKVVEHRSMLPPGTPYQESFNSNVIELNLHRIPGLSPLYLYANNDMFLGRELKLSDLFAPAHLDLVNDEFCDLVPLTYYEVLGQHWFPYPTVTASGWAVQKRTDTWNASWRNEFERMVEWNILLLSSPNYSVPFLRHRLDAGDNVSAVPLYRYAHLPILYDRAAVEWMLRHPAIAPAVQETMTRPHLRGDTDVWVPFLYINTRRLALYGPLQTQERLFRHADPSMCRFSQLKDETSVKSEFHHVALGSAAFSPELFITLNDDFPTTGGSLAVNPSHLFDDTAAVIGTIRCDATFINATAKRERRALVDSLAVRTLRQLIQLHHMYCRWDQYWSQQPIVGLLNVVLPPFTARHNDVIRDVVAR